MRELALFAGAGGGILGGLLLGWRTVCAVELDAYCRKVLLARQRDGILSPFPIWDDVRTFDGKPWRGHVDIVTGGFPCQDISVAGTGAGIDGERSGLWREMARIIGEVRPRFALVENSPMLTVRGLGRVLGDLAALGYNARWAVLGATHVGAPHKRERIWIMGSNAHEGDAAGTRITAGREDRFRDTKAFKEWNRGIDELVSGGIAERAHSYAGALRILDGLAHRNDRLAALGNGQVPHCMALAWSILGANFIKR